MPDLGWKFHNTNMPKPWLEEGLGVSMVLDFYLLRGVEALPLQGYVSFRSS
jgi:hypothetical protein